MSSLKTKLTAAPLSSLMNIGAKTEQMLKDIGIMTADDLREIGAVNAYLRLVAMGYPKHLMILYALEGAVKGVNLLFLTAEEKAALQQAVTPLAAPKKAPKKMKKG
ncbi:MAG TPA: TfoX/Sxy family protein [Aggregatilineales bacterium]|nr:TfoX/Sxy family protein [Anaerolineales bacterium]HRE47858.1 TfoX/Sxy family protein [Aggregatilineales bacterium]